MPLKGPTSNHDEIRRWANARHARPIEVVEHRPDGDPTLMRFVFGPKPLASPEFKLLEWDEFFARLDLLGLAVVYEDGDNPQHTDYEIVQIEEKNPYNLRTWRA